MSHRPGRLKQAVRFAQTTRHLRPQQWLGQAWMRGRRLWRPLVRRAIQRTSLPEECVIGPVWFAPTVEGEARQADARGRFCFVGQEHETGWPPRWGASMPSLLWQYNLHYFDWLWSIEREEGLAAVFDWIDFAQDHPQDVAWDPYPTSLRLLNWCGVLLAKYRLHEQPDSAEFQKVWASLREQADWLCYHLEFHLMGNHLLENAAALALLGSVFRGPCAERWYRLGSRLLHAELEEQLLADGLHFERSPMYHLRITYLVLLIAMQGRPVIAGVARERLPSMFEAMHHLSHPDGQIALLNDSAFGIYPGPGQLMRNAQQIPGLSVSFPEVPAQGLHGWQLAEAGYYGFRIQQGHYLVCDAGPIGPDYIPGHAHSDIFSFELSLFGHRVVVDSGVFDYVDSPMRAYCRSTRAHNTVVVDDLDQSVMWGAFRVAARRAPHDVRWSSTPEHCLLQGWHDGYADRTIGKVRHERRFDASASHLAIVDQISASRIHRAEMCMHLAPSCRVQQLTRRQAVVATPGGEVTFTFSGEGVLRCEEGLPYTSYCPRFSVAASNQVLLFGRLGQQSQFGCEIRWSSS